MQTFIRELLRMASMGNRRRKQPEGKLGRTFAELVSAKTIAKYLGTSTDFVMGLSRDPSFPPAVYLNKTTKRWSAVMVDIWIAQNAVVSANGSTVKGRKVPKVEPVVYFIRCGMNVKIGFAGNVQQRLAGLQTACPEPLEIIHTIPGSFADEQELHKRFAASRIRTDGEWFRLTDDILQFIGESL